MTQLNHTGKRSQSSLTLHANPTLSSYYCPLLTIDAILHLHFVRLKRGKFYLSLSISARCYIAKVSLSHSFSSRFNNFMLVYDFHHILGRRIGDILNSSSSLIS